MLYSASDIAVLTENQLSTHPFLARVGPDILDKKLTPEFVAERLASKPFRNRALGGLYLDQSFLAGNGNYLRSEILWASQLHPKRRPADLTFAELQRLARQTLTIARRSYRTRGVTAPASAARQRKAAGLSYEQRRFQAYGREDLACYRCGEPIERFTLASRSLFACPKCQSA